MVDQMSSLMALRTTLKSANLLDNTYGDIDGLEVTGITQDSRSVKKGDLFVAWKGSEWDAHDFLDSAARSGASAALVERRVPGIEIPQIQVSDGRLAAAIAADLFFDSPWENLFVAAVTGTNGKTTTAFLSRHLLQAQYSAATVGTVGLVKADGLIEGGSDNLTTPGPVEVSNLMRNLLNTGVESVVIEASSHALTQHRLSGVRFDSVIFTNLSGDHLDYHKDMNDYFRAKASLLGLLKDDGTIIINADDSWWTKLDTQGYRKISYGIEESADITADIVKMELGSTILEVTRGSEKESLNLPLSGRFNVDNCLAAVSLATVAGLELGDIADRLRCAPQVPGRLEVVAREPFLVIIDFAHTSAALRNIISTVRRFTEGRLIVVFGAGGDRDRSKRSEMGRMVSEGADLAIVTSDNPRSEDPDSIIADVIAGMTSKDIHTISDRKSAITLALSEAREGDCVLLAGKGHELVQVVGKEKQAFDERAIILDNLEMLGGAV